MNYLLEQFAFERDDDGGERLWQRAHVLLKRSFETHGHVLINILEDAELPEGWTGSFTGLVVDVGLDRGQRWLDVEFRSHTRINEDAKRHILGSDTYRKLLKTMFATDSAIITPDINKHVSDAQMYASVQEVIGNRQVLEPPVGTQRLDPGEIGTAMVILTQPTED